MLVRNAQIIFFQCTKILLNAHDKRTTPVKTVPIFNHTNKNLQLNQVQDRNPPTTPTSPNHQKKKKLPHLRQTFRIFAHLPEIMFARVPSHIPRNFSIHFPQPRAYVSPRGKETPSRALQGKNTRHNRQYVRHEPGTRVYWNAVRRPNSVRCLSSELEGDRIRIMI